jgi:predicted PurR-regulated permease PerM
MGQIPPDPDAPRSPPPGDQPPKADDAEELRKQAAELRGQNLALRAQVDELKAIAAPLGEPPRSLQQLHLFQIQPVRDLLVILLVLGVLYLGYILRPLTVPLLLALMLAYLFEPVVRRMTATERIGRPLAAVCIIFTMILVVTLPVGFGVAFATIQGVHTGRQFTTNLAVLRRSVENHDDEELAARVAAQGRGWAWVRDFVVKAKEEAAVTDPESPTAPETDPPLDNEAVGTSRAPAPPDHPAAGTEPEVLAADAIAEQRERQRTPAALEQRLPPLGAPVETAQPHTPLSVQLIDWLNDWVQRSAASLGAAFGRQALGTGMDVLRIVWRVVASSAYLLFAIFLIFFFFFFFSVNYQRVLNSLAELIPQWKRARTLEMIRKMDTVVSGFIRGRLIIMCILTVMFIIGYWTVGVPMPLVIGLVIGVLSLVPYLSLVGIPLTILLMWLQPVPGMPPFMYTWWWVIFAPSAIYMLVQMSDDYVWTPMIQGKATDMDIPSILFAVLAGGILAGFYGVLLAIPAAACIKILLKEAFWPRFRAWSEGRVKDFLPVSRYDPTATQSTAPPPRP